MWSNTRRGAQFLDGTVPKLIRAIEGLTETLKESQMKEDEDEITRRVLHAAVDACGGRSVDIAEMIDDLERKIISKEAVEQRLCQVFDLSTKHVPCPEPDWGSLRALSHTHGWVVYVDGCGDIPEWFEPLHTAAIENKCLLINFDSAADTVDCFETWEW
jgi:hypothetical protein